MPAFSLMDGAVCSPENEARCNERRDSILAAVKPANIVEQVLAAELFHASWEMERVRELSGDPAVEDRLNAAYSRASRNWRRSLKQLKTLQTARATHFAKLYTAAERTAGEACPFADLAKVPVLPGFPGEVQ
ncbi:MAG TPA: hypothetical protein VFQ91_10400 [Bryobacteraceae bacterium]|nr:hypothetical protein [Bryobacteraceae bacterium]